MKKRIRLMTTLFAAFSTVAIAGEFVLINTKSSGLAVPDMAPLCTEFLNVLNSVPLEERHKLVCSLPEFPKNSGFRNIDWQPMDDPIEGIKAVRARHGEPDNDMGWSERAEWQLQTATASIDLLHDGVQRNFLQLSYLSHYCVPVPDYTPLRGAQELNEEYGGNDRQAFDSYVQTMRKKQEETLTFELLSTMPWARTTGIASLDPISEEMPAKVYPADLLFFFQGKVWGYGASSLQSRLNNPNQWDNEGDAGSAINLYRHVTYTKYKKVEKQRICQYDYVAK